jgi:hypothetical protein
VNVWSLHAFGIEMRSDLPLVGATSTVAESAPPAVEITRLEGEVPGPEDGKPLLERLHADGSLGMRVTRLAGGNYWIEAPGHGRFKVADDGSVVWYDRLAQARWRWHRPLCAQALPLAATLQGFELLHASAVRLHGHAVAFVAQSGGGKTSLALALLARGAPLVTDDVLALEATGGSVVAHPGVAMANIAAEQLGLLGEPVRAELGEAMGASDKVHVEVSNICRAPLPLGAVFFLTRSQAVDRLTVELAEPPDPRDLLAATFMPHIVAPSRLVTQLATCAEIAASVPLFRLTAPVGLSASQLASAVEHQVAESLG